MVPGNEYRDSLRRLKPEIYYTGEKVAEKDISTTALKKLKPPKSSIAKRYI